MNEGFNFATVNFRNLSQVTFGSVLSLSHEVFVRR